MSLTSAQFVSRLVASGVRYALTDRADCFMLAGVSPRRSRLVALVATILVLSGHLAECRGWLATPEARMECCEDEQECPMHKSGKGDAFHELTQAAADQCCATGTQADDSLPTAAHSAPADASVSVSVVAKIIALPARPWDAASLEQDTGPPGARSRHVLFSVFLI
jgi:hypothetical protein